MCIHIGCVFTFTSTMSVVGTFVKQLPAKVLCRLRSTNESVQQVVEIIKPGARGPSQWDPERQQAAERAVQRALDIWKQQKREDAAVHWQP